MTRGWLGDWRKRGLPGRRPGGRVASAVLGTVLGALGTLALAGCGDNLALLPDADLAPEPSEYQPASVGLVNLIGGAAGEVYAVLHDRPDPLAPRLVTRQGVCSLYLRPVEARCSPSCGADVCVAANECAPASSPVSAGDITVSGLRQRLVFHADLDGYKPESLPPVDLFDSGARIRVSAPGDRAGGFVAELDGVPHLQVAFSRISLRRGKDTRLTWTAAGVGRVAAAIFVGRPGAPFSSMLLCEADDYGDLTIPAGIAARLPGAEPGETSSATMMRLSRAVLPAHGLLGEGPIEVIAGQKVAVDLVRE